MPQAEFDGCVEAYRQALADFVRGDPAPVMELFSQRDDVTLANPVGPPHRGWAEVEKAIKAAAANFAGGSGRFDEVSRFHTADLGYVVQLEVFEVRLVGREGSAPSSLRVTMIFRREDDVWKVAHRHADPITTARPIDTILDP
ncbi:MAG TPA: nuclear transport factor 2 family protein [Microthrixaceae bacterium]|nr:nuclear transport factor 2 family protein [Microthrixaceae bacterium]